MKVLHLVAGSLSGGAARGALWLHQAQREIGIDSILVTSGHARLGDDSVIALGASKFDRLKFSLLRRLGNLPTLLYRNRKKLIFNTGFGGTDITKLPQYEDADIIHLHWINGLVAIRTLSKVKKPIVWTLRDMWPLTGGCHVGAALGCDRYIDGCGECPQLNSRCSLDLTRIIAEYKRTVFPKHMHLVGVSRWISDCATSSYVFHDYPVQTISNNIDTRVFLPVDQQSARKQLNLPLNKRIILVGAQNLNDYHKGFKLFLTAINTIQQKNCHIVTIGKVSNEGTIETGINSTHFGLLSDTDSLRMVYSAADVFVAPSLMDTFPKTPAESLSCCTPVVCFDATGMKDIVDHKVTGYRAIPFETDDLAKGIEWILSLPSDQYKLMRQNSRERAVNYFDTRHIAKQYKELYLKMLD